MVRSGGVSQIEGMLTIRSLTGEECWCGNEVPSVSLRKKDEDCNVPCSGAGGVMCGGNYLVTVYALDIAAVGPAMPNTTSDGNIGNGTDVNSHALLTNDTVTTAESAMTSIATDSASIIGTGQPGPEPTQTVTTENGVIMTLTQNDAGQTTAPLPSGAGAPSVTSTASVNETTAIASDPVTTDPAAITTTDPAAITTTDPAATTTNDTPSTIDPAAAAVITGAEGAPTSSVTTIDPAQVTTQSAQPAESNVATAQVTTIPGTTQVITEELQSTTHASDGTTVWIWSTTKTVEQGPQTSTIGASGSATPIAIKRDLIESIESIVSKAAYGDETEPTSTA
jgi:hypothetical protein